MFYAVYYLATVYVRFLVRVSYLEIYNEEVRDLLGKDQMQRLEVHLIRSVVDVWHSVSHFTLHKV